MQPRFPAGDQPSIAGFRSISGLRLPDIVLTWSTSAHGTNWAVFDAKYRTGRRNILDAMSSAHIYRDALRWHGNRPECALLLVPRAGGASWLEQPEFMRRHRVGVYPLSTDTVPETVSQGLFGKALQSKFWSLTSVEDNRGPDG